MFNLFNKYFLLKQAPAYSLQYWRERILFTIYFSCAVFGFIAYIPSVYLSYDASLWGVLILDTAAYFGLLFVFLNKKISYKAKSWILTSFVYALSVMLMFVIGPLGPGFLYLFSFAILSALLFSRTNAVYLLVITILTFITLFFIVAGQLPEWIPKIEYNASIWIVNSANFIFLSSLTSLSVMVLIHGMNKYATQEREISEELSKEKVIHEELINRLNEEIIEKQKIQNELSETGKKLSAVFEQAAEGIIFHDYEGIIYSANRYICELLGYDKDEIVKFSIFDLETAENNMSAQERLNNIRFSGAYSYDTEFTAKNGLIMPVEIKAQNIEFESGSFVMSIIRDQTENIKKSIEFRQIITRLEEKIKERTDSLEKTVSKLHDESSYKRRLEDDLQKAQNEISKAFENEKKFEDMKSQFVAMVSHEYRTPLTVILSSSYILEKIAEPYKNEDFNKYMSRLRISVERMAALIEDVLILGKGDYTVKAQLIKQDIVGLIRKVIEDAKRIDKGEHLIEFNHSSDLIYLNTDKDMIIRIVNNLLSNSLKFTPKGRMAAVELNENGIDVRIKVYDNGIGISEEDQKSLFEPFHRGGNAGFIAGSGLGLAVAKNYVERLKGKIYINSSVNVGTTVTVILPK